jgi:hypothetical protein
MMKIIRQNADFIWVIAITLFLSSLLYLNFDYFYSVYQEKELNNIITSFMGLLFGMLLTAYSILFGLIPALKKDFLETRAFSSTNFRFFLSIFISLIIFLLSFTIYFIDGFVVKVLIFTQVLLTIFLIMLSFLLAISLYLIFKIAKVKKPPQE